MVNKRMKYKIAVIGAKGFPGVGGAAKSNEQIFVRLVNSFDVTVYALETYSHDQNYKGIHQINFKKYSSKKMTNFIYYLKSALHALFLSKYDLIHLNHHISGFIVPILRIKYKVVFNIHGLPYDKDDKYNYVERQLNTLFFKIGLRLSNRVISVDKSSIQKLIKYTRFNVIYIPNGVENNFKLIHNYDCKIKYDITFAAARIISLKGLHILLEALYNICFRCRIQVIGDIEQVENYKLKVKALANKLNVHFKGILKDRAFLFQCIAQSKLFVFPSFSEGMSNMLLEVASLKVPIIASDIQQNRDIFGERDVLFFKVGNPSDLALKIKWSLVNYSEMIAKAENAYQKVLREHNWDDICERYKEIYENIVIK